MEACSFFFRNFTLFAILFTVPALILAIVSRIRGLFKLPLSAGSDWMVLLITFDATSLMGRNNYQAFFPSFLQENYYSFFLILFLLELLILVTLVFTTERVLINVFLKEHFNQALEGNKYSELSLWTRKFSCFVSTYIFFAINIYIFIAR